MTQPNVQQIVDDASGKDESALDDDSPELDDIGRDLDLLMRKVRTRIKAHGDGQRVLDTPDVAEMVSELVLITMEHLAHTKAQEEHAIWATETISNFEKSLGDTAEASQLHAADAEKIRAYANGALALVTTLQAAASAGGEGARVLEPWHDQLLAVAKDSAEILSLVDELDLSLGDDDEPDEPDEPAPADTTASE